MLLIESHSIYWVLPVAESAWLRSLLEVDDALFSKKRAKSGWRRERKMIWAPLNHVVSTRCCKRVEDRSAIPSLGECHPEDEHELEDVVEGEPVDGVDGRLNDGEEGVGDPVLQAGCQRTVAQSMRWSNSRSTTGCHRPC